MSIKIRYIVLLSLWADIINSKKKSKSHTLCIRSPWMWLCLTSGLYMYYYNHHQSKIAIYRLQRWGCGVNSLPRWPMHDAKILKIPYYTQVLNSNDSAIETFSIKLQKHKIANTDYFIIVYIYPKSKCEILKLYVFLAFYLGFTACIPRV